MWFYILLFTFCIFALVLNNKIKRNQKKVVEIVTLIILCIVSGTRYYLGGTDYYVYKTVYDNMPNIHEFILNYPNLHDNYITFGFETGYLLLNSLIKTLGLNFFGFTLLNSIFFYTCLYLGLRRYTFNFNLLILVFLYKLFFYNTFISMRQSITLAIFFLAIHFIHEKKPIRYFSLSFLAVFFHNAAFILLPVYFINKFKLTKKKIIMANIIFLPTLLISFFNLPVMQVFDFIVNFFENSTAKEKAENLFIGTPSSSIGIFHILEYILMMSIVIFFYEKLIKINNAEFIIKIFLLLLPIFTLFSGYEILTRVKDYFILTYAIILGFLCIINYGKYRNIVQIGIIVICAFGFFRFIVLFDGGAMIPYKSFLIEGISIFN